MKKLRNITTALLFATIALTCRTAVAASTGELLQQGLYAEQVEGNLNAAIKSYDQVVKNGSAPRNHVAQALYREGMCYLKLNNDAAAKAALQKLVNEYSDQADIAEKGKSALDDLTDFDPAAIMPPGTLIYLEFGSPGTQVEMILNMLKGTPFENPLAAIGGQGTNTGRKTPGDIVGALLNPSMVTEFKKIRSSAIGITGLTKNQPSIVSVLYPGKSDALKGIIQAGLGMAGTPGEAIDGMQTVKLPEDMAAAYDDRVIITTRPASQLAWCVKQYKGQISEPTLASSNKSFEKLSKGQREKNALTLWAKVDETYARFLQMLPPGHIPPQIHSANAILDFTNIDDLTLTASVEPSGLGWKSDVQFKDGHHCLIYDLIRTPNISKTALEAVPAEAVAVASFSLSQGDSARANQVRSAVQNVTGLDLGREVFANIEQVTLFVLPGGGSAADSGSPAFLATRLGLAITSHNPAQTRQLLGTVLGTANSMSASRGETVPGRYKVGSNGKQDIYCYLEQAGPTTLLSLSRDVVEAALSAVRNHKSICASGPLNGVVNKLAPATSKLLLIDAGAAIRLLGPQLKVGNLNQEQAAQLKSSLEQLARAADSTTLELRTDEQRNEFALKVGISGIPPLNQIIGPASQIQRLSREARAETAARKLQQQQAATILPAPGAPVIDGQVDDVWNNARSYPLANVLYAPDGSTNLPAADYRALWDETNLYVLVNVTDHTLQHDPALSWHNNDSVELYLDADNSKLADYGQTDFQYSFNWDKTSPQMQELKHDRVEGVQYALVTTDEGYRLEIKLPWSTLGTQPSVGGRIGLDVQVNDNQGRGKRDAKIAWHDQRDNAWKSPQAFGNAELAGLIGWWKFDETEGKTAKDSSGRNHDGTLVGSATWGQGKIGGAVALDGADGFVRIADPSAFDLAGEFTISCWVNIHSVPVAWMAIVTKGDNSWRLSTVGQERRFHFSGMDGSTTVNTDEWHLVTAVYDGHAKRLYLDGKLDAEQPVTGGFGRDNSDVLIGENAERTGRFFDGLIDDVRIYNYALPESRIQALAAGR